MTNLKRWWKKSWGIFDAGELNIPIRAAWIFLFLGLAGFVNAAYLSVQALAGRPVVCFAGADCDKVLLSAYAKLFGIPVALFGAGFYLAIFLLAVYCLEAKNKKVFRALFPLSWLGFLFSVYLFLLQALIINSFCSYCVVSAILATLLFAATIYLCIRKNGQGG